MWNNVKLAVLPSNQNATNASKSKQSALLNEVLKKVKRDSGLDYRKIIMNDHKENQRLRMKQYNRCNSDWGGCVNNFV